MSHPCRPFRRGPRLSLWALASLAAFAAAPAPAASKRLVAALGDDAPGGGVFAGPSFTGWPAAAGTRWIAFRGKVAGGDTTEALIVAHPTLDGVEVVAGIGQPAPGGDAFKQFVGRPAVNANGEVAFLALLSGDGADDPAAPTPAGVYLFRHHRLDLVARAGQSTDAGQLDLTAPLDTGEDVVERSPAINDAGDVAFLAALRDNAQAAGAIFLATADAGQPIAVVRLGDAYDGGEFTTLGPPALNNDRALAFHARASTSDPNDDDGVVDGIFTFADGASVRVRDGQQPMGSTTPLRDFADPVAFNDRGDLAFLAGPLFDDDGGTDAERLGVVVCRGGVVIPLAGSGLAVEGDHLTGIRLGAAAGRELAAPALAPDGSVAFFGTLRGDAGSSEVIARWDGSEVTAVAYTSGARASTTPAGGTYAGAESAPAIDATGGVVFLARIVAGSSSQAVVYQPPTGDGVPVVVGDPVLDGAIFAGQPFSSPLLNDRGDVVFRAFVAQAEASVGIFRFRDGALDAVVRAGDPSPAAGAPFDDLPGQAGINAGGAVVFAGHVADHGVGIFVADANGLRTVAQTGDPAPDAVGGVFRSFGTAPSINDDGAVAFRATTLVRTPEGTERRESIFLSDPGGIRVVASAGDMTPAGLPLLALRDPVVSNAPAIAFRASLGETDKVGNGLFVADRTGLIMVAAELDDLGGGVTLSGFSGDPAINATGDLAFLVTRSREVVPGTRRALGPAILRHSAARLVPVIAKDMPGPAGGTFRSLGQPALNRLGHLAFRGSFLPATGGTPGLFLETPDGIEPYLTLGEVTLLGEGTTAKGRITRVSSRPAMNADDDLAFTATMSGGTARSGVFLASRTTLEVQRLAIRRGRRGHDRIRLTLLLHTGRTSTGLDPAHEAVTVSLTDARGALWSATVPAGGLTPRGRGLISTPRRGGSLRRVLRTLRVDVPEPAMARATVTSAPLDLTRGGERLLTAPFTATLQVSDDSGSRIVSCPVRRRGVRCTPS